MMLKIQVKSCFANRAQWKRTYNGIHENSTYNFNLTYKYPIDTFEIMFPKGGSKVYSPFRSTAIFTCLRIHCVSQWHQFLKHNFIVFMPATGNPSICGCHSSRFIHLSQFNCSSFISIFDHYPNKFFYELELSVRSRRLNFSLILLLVPYFTLGFVHS